MKTICKKILLCVFSALFAVSAVIFGLTLALGNNNNGIENKLPVSSLADATNPTTVTISTDKTTVSAGGTFELKMTATTLRTNVYWMSLIYSVIPINDDGSINSALAPYFSLVPNSTGYTDIFKDKDYKAMFVDKFQTAGSTGCCMYFSLSYQGSFVSVTESNNVEMWASIKVDDSISSLFGTEPFTVKFGLFANSANKITFRDTSAATMYNDACLKTMGVSSQINYNSVTLTLAEPSDDTTVKEILVGSDPTNMDEIDLDTKPYEFKFDNPDLNEFYIQVTPNDDNATVQVAVNGGTPEDAQGGQPKQVPLQPGTNTVTVKITAENGDTEEYTITVTVSYARLDTLVVDSATATAGVTKKGLSTTFDSDVVSYIAYLPSDGRTATVTATVLDGYGSSKTITIGTKDCNAPPTVTSGTPFTVQSLSDGSELYLTVKATDGSEMKYTVVFEEVSVNTAISSITATGVDSGDVYSPDATKATFYSVDYYFNTLGDTESTLTISPVIATAGITIDGTDYDSTKKYSAGTYSVEITAPAGNTSTYSVMLSQPDVLELSLDSDYYFVAEQTVTVSGWDYNYRRTYEELGWTHGIDDVDLDRVVLGQIEPGTSVSKFLENFSDDTVKNLKIYTLDGDVLFNCGKPGDGIIQSELESDLYYRIHTGAYVELLSNGQVIDTVYLSVLGDLDGEGYVDATDASMLYMYALGDALAISQFDNVEFRLAAYIANFGDFSVSDAAIIYMFVTDQAAVQDFYYPTYVVE